MNSSEKVEVVPYNPEWPFLFEKEAERIKHAFDFDWAQIFYTFASSMISQ